MTGAKRALATVLVCVAMVPVACTKSAGQAGGGGAGDRTTTPPSPVGGTPSTGTTSPTGGTIVQTDLDGTWSGPWADSTGNTTGTFELGWRQDGSKLTGTITINGTFCLTGGAVTGDLGGSRIEFELVGLAQRNVELKYEGTATGLRMSGTYSTNCDNTTGTWKATKTG
jgi:hypothetical protein